MVYKRTLHLTTKKTIANDALSFTTKEHHEKYSTLIQENHLAMKNQFYLFESLLNEETFVFVFIVA